MDTVEPIDSSHYDRRYEAILKAIRERLLACSAPPANEGMPTELVAPIFLSLRQTQSIVPCGRTFIYEQIKSGEIEAVKLGARTFLLTTSLARFLSTRPRLFDFDSQFSLSSSSHPRERYEPFSTDQPTWKIRKHQRRLTHRSDKGRK